MSRSLRTALYLLGSLALAFYLTPWDNYTGFLDQIRTIQIPLLFLLAFLSGSLRLKLGKEPRFLAGLALSFLAWKLCSRLVPMEREDTRILLQSLSVFTWWSAFFALHQTIEIWQERLESFLEKKKIDGSWIYAALASLALALGPVHDLPFVAVAASAGLLSFVRNRLLKASPASFEVLAAMILGTLWLNHWHAGEGGTALRTGLPAASYLLMWAGFVLLWEKLPKLPHAWASFLAYALLFGALGGRGEHAIWTQTLLCFAAAVFLWSKDASWQKHEWRPRVLGLAWVLALAVLMKWCSSEADPLRLAWPIQWASLRLFYVILAVAAWLRVRSLGLKPEILENAALLLLTLPLFPFQGHALLWPALPLVAGILFLLTREIWTESISSRLPELPQPLSGLAALWAWIVADDWFIKSGTLGKDIFVASILVTLVSYLRVFWLKLPPALLKGLVLLYFASWLSDADGRSDEKISLLLMALGSLLYLGWEELRSRKALWITTLLTALLLPLLMSFSGSQPNWQWYFKALLFKIAPLALVYVGWLFWLPWEARVLGRLKKAWEELEKKLPSWARPADGKKAAKGGGEFWMAEAALGSGMKWVKEHPSQMKKAGLAAAVAVLLSGLWTVYQKTATVVTSFTPSGEVASPSTVVVARFSKDVSMKGADLEGAISIEPPLAGTTRLSDSKTLAFEPSQPLAPSTEYKATLRTDKLSSTSYYMQRSAGTSFHTPFFAVQGLRLYYVMDILGETERELVGELDFNYEVDLNELKKHLQLNLDGKDLAYTLEKGLLPRRFYFRATGFKRLDDARRFDATVRSGLACLGCAVGLKDGFSQSIQLSARPRFELQGVEPHHEPGNTFISIGFSLPLKLHDAKAAISVTEIDRKGKEGPFGVEVSSEHAYVVLRGDFKPNMRYKVRIKEFLKSRSGQLLEVSRNIKGERQDQLREVGISDASPYAKFADEGHYLPLDGSGRLAVKTMNLDSFNVSVGKVYRNNLVHYLREGGLYGGHEGRHGYGRRYFDKQVEVQGGLLNEDVITHLDAGAWHRAPYKGVFSVELRAPNSYETSRRWFIATDLGLVAKRSGDDLWVQAISISSLQPLPGVKIELVSNNNQVMQSSLANEEGRVSFPNYQKHSENIHPYLVLATAGDDLSFLPLENSEVSQSRFDIGGDPVRKDGFEGWLTTERGLYRPGDTVNFTGLLRRHDLQAVDLPLQLNIYNPQGSEIYKGMHKPQEEGLFTHSMDMRLEALTGDYRATLSLPTESTGKPHQVLSEAGFKIEEFIPNKIKAEIEIKNREAEAGGKVEYKVKVQHLFGAPAAGLKVKTQMELAPGLFSHPSYADYHFADTERQFNTERLGVPKGSTDDKGAYEVSLDVPVSVLPASMILGRIYAEVLDSGGRPVGAHGTVRIHRYPYYLGLKSESGKLVQPGTLVKVSAVAISPSGAPQTLKKLPLIIKRRVWYSIFHKSGWRSGYQSSYYDEVVEAREYNISGKGGISFSADKEGEYTVILGGEEGMRSRITVKVEGAPQGDASVAASANLQEPGVLPLALDRNHYSLGESAQVDVVAPFPGRLLLSVERDGIISRREQMVPAGRSSISIPVDAACSPNAYVVGLLIRRPSENLKSLPMTSFGIVPLMVDKRSSRMDLNWDAPTTVRSDRGIDVDLDLGTPGAKAVIASVDEGILQIISFQTPDPFAYFYRKRGLGITTLTFFDKVLPDLQRKFAVGGDEDEGFVGRHLNPVAAKKLKTYARFSGILTAGADGHVRHHFDTDEFQGEARVMALAVKGPKMGSKAFKVKVADPIVLQTHFPRFLAPDDTAKVTILAFNQTEKAQKVKFVLTAKGPVKVSGKTEIEHSMKAKSNVSLEFDITALKDAGEASFSLSASTGEGETFTRKAELTVRPGQPLSSVVRYGKIDPGSSRDIPVPGDFIPFGRKARVLVTNSPLAEFMGAFDSLVRYPYGCAEQKTSQAFPLLYLKDAGLLGGVMSLRSDVEVRRRLDKIVQKTVSDLEEMQTGGGGFQLWSGDSYSHDWLSNYVTHFILEARRQGYAVKAQTLTRIKGRIGDIQATHNTGRLDRREHNTGAVNDDPYVLYLRVLAGTPELEAMKAHLEPEAIKRLGFSDRCILAMAFGEMGDHQNAGRAMPAKLDHKTLYRATGGNWDSSNRELALFLLAKIATNAPNAELSPLVEEFKKRLRAEGHFGTTQENAWALAALAKAVKKLENDLPMQAGLKVGDGAESILTSSKTLLSDEQAIFGKTLKLSNQGQGPLRFIMLAEGTRLESAKPEEKHGLQIRRVYRDEEGKELNLGAITQGQLIVVTLEVEASREVEHLVIVDLLPAGFEVDNPRLQSQGRLGFEPPANFDVASADYRDDRVLLFSAAGSSHLSFSYSVRAVTPGRFTVPALLCEAMYDPDIYGSWDPKTALVVAPGKF